MLREEKMKEDRKEGKTTKDIPTESSIEHLALPILWIIQSRYNFPSFADPRHYWKLKVGAILLRKKIRDRLSNRGTVFLILLCALGSGSRDLPI